MNSTIILRSGLAAALLAGALIAAVRFFAITPVSPVADGLQVAATIFPLADIIRQVGGEHVQVQLIIPPGVTEHSHALTPRQLQELQRVRVIFQIGHGLDNRLTERIVAALPQAETVTVDRGIALREFGETVEHAEDEHDEEEAEEEYAHDTGTDPHYWLTVSNAGLIAATVTEALTRLDPVHAEEFAQNLATYQAELDRLEAELQTTAAQVPKREFIALHNAWSYFAAHYGLELVATYEPVEGREPSLQDLQRLQGIIAEHSLTTFFTEPQKASGSVTAFMQREFGLRVLELDPVGGRAETASYLDLMRYNMQAIVSGAR